jgi:hypothetical protein
MLTRRMMSCGSWLAVTSGACAGSASGLVVVVEVVVVVVAVGRTPRAALR